MLASYEVLTYNFVIVDQHVTNFAHITKYVLHALNCGLYFDRPPYPP